MTKSIFDRTCGACGKDIPVYELGEHIDGHSDLELEHWPGGGFDAAIEAVKESLEFLRRMQREKVAGLN